MANQHQDFVQIKQENHQGYPTTPIYPSNLPLATPWAHPQWISFSTKERALGGERGGGVNAVAWLLFPYSSIGKHPTISQVTNAGVCIMHILAGRGGRGPFKQQGLACPHSSAAHPNH
uniref:Uncharacterized protein n=1 Tax=Ditylenchus dipsaci TaxID=166011 RepID=A0A915EG63_9BILA